MASRRSILERVEKFALGFGGDHALMHGIQESSFWLKSALFPHFCVVCGREGLMLCRDCSPGIMQSIRGVFRCPGCGHPSVSGLPCGRPRCRPILSGSIAVAPYAAIPLRRLLQAYKYAKADEAGQLMDTLIGCFVLQYRTVLDMYMHDAVIIPVPLDAIRFAFRGFNQSERIAMRIATIIGKEDFVWTDALTRAYRHRRQADITDSRDRLQNISGAYRVTEDMQGIRSVVLVDDVTTSGATLNACAEALLAVGVERVYGITFLRG